MSSNSNNDNERAKKLCKYCAEEIYEEAVICRFCGKKQKNIVDKVGDSLEENRGKHDVSMSYIFLVWLPSILLLLSAFYFASVIPAIIGVAYWCYMYYKYDLKV